MADQASSTSAWPTWFGAFDMQALRYLYGSKPYASNDNTYQINTTNAGASLSIVDDGGNDTLEGGGGDDVFTFSIGHGHDLVNDFDQWGDDVLSFSKNMFASWNAVAAATKQVGADVVIATSATSSVRLLNTSLSSFNADDIRLAA